MTSLSPHGQKNLRGEMMKTFKYGKLIGVGMGAGLAVAAAYNFTTSPAPKSFQPHAGEFRSLADLDSGMLLATEPAVPVDDATSLTLPPLKLKTPTNQSTISVDSNENEFQFSVDLNQPSELDKPMQADESLDELLVELAADQESSTAQAEPTLIETTLSATTELDPSAGDTSTAEIDELIEFDDKEWRSFIVAEAASTTDESMNIVDLAPDANLTGSAADSNDRLETETTPMAVVKSGVDSTATQVPSNRDSGARTMWTKNPFHSTDDTTTNTTGATLTPKGEEFVGAFPIVAPPESVAPQSLSLSTATDETTRKRESSVIDFGSDSAEAAFDRESEVTDVSQADLREASLATVVAQPMQFSNQAARTPANIPDLSTPQAAPTDPYSIAPLNTKVSESVAQRAAQHIEYGKTLARRGASFVAKQEFYSALQVLAQANDEKTGINEFSLSLRRAIIAMKEAEDFMVTDTETQIGLNVGLVAETHRCGILTKEEAALLSPIEAMQRYFADAQTQLQRAAGSNVVSAEALYCLGKLHTVDSQTNPTAGRLEIAKAIVYHRAALASDQKNHRSANELGVLLARSGQLAEARDLFKSSLRVQPVPQTWENLAKIHQRLNEPQLAQLASVEFQRTSQMQSITGGEIQWKPNGQFNADAPLEFHEAIAAKPAAPAQSTAEKLAVEKPGEEKSKSIGEKIKDFF